MKFMYDGCYLEIEGKPEGDRQDANIDCNDPECYLWPIGLSLSIHQIADKYGIDALTQVALQRLRTLFSMKLRALDDRWIIAEEVFSREGVRHEVLELTKDFLIGKLDNHSSYEDLQACPGFERFSRQYPETAGQLLRHEVQDASKFSRTRGKSVLINNVSILRTTQNL